MNSLFELELKRLINSHNIEKGSNTPDFMLARYLMNCLENWKSIIEDRDRWYRKEPPTQPPPIDDTAKSPMKWPDNAPETGAMAARQKNPMV